MTDDLYGHRHEIRCWRCEVPAEVDWCDIAMISDPAPVYIPSRIVCVTPGCIDLFSGTSATSADPPSPERLHRAADEVAANLRQLLGG